MKGDGGNKDNQPPHEAIIVSQMMTSLGHGKTDIALDLHNTTSNVGVMLILELRYNKRKFTSMKFDL